jgi:hypothetical protein
MSRWSAGDQAVMDFQAIIYKVEVVGVEVPMPRLIHIQ